MSNDDELAAMIAQLAEVTPEDERGHVCIEVFHGPSDAEDILLAMHIERLGPEDVIAVLLAAATQVEDQVRAARAILN